MAPLGNTSGGGGGGDGSDSGCRIDKIFDTWLKQRILESSDLIASVKTLYQWNITKKGKIASIWSKLNTNENENLVSELLTIFLISAMDLKNEGGAVHRGPPKTGKPDCTFTIDDNFAVDVFEGREDAMKVISVFYISS